MKIGRNRENREAASAVADAEIPWQVAARLQCLEMAVERRTEGMSAKQIIEAATEFYAWATTEEAAAEK